MGSRWSVNVMAGLGPAIHVLRCLTDKDLDADLRRHDDERQVSRS